MGTITTVYKSKFKEVLNPNLLEAYGELGGIGDRLLLENRRFECEGSFGKGGGVIIKIRCD